MNLGNGVHLTYCTNIHAGESWPEARQVLEVQLPAVREALHAHQKAVPWTGPRDCCDVATSDEMFGVGLRLAADAARSLQVPSALEDCRRLLHENGLYVFTINGFPYGHFHGRSVKECVYRPDWLDPRRLHYTNQLADILVVLLKDAASHAGQADLAGSISTVPISNRESIHSEADECRAANALIMHVAHLVSLERQSGVRIALALEPEPCCHLETIAQTVRFFEKHLHSQAAADRLMALAAMSPRQAAAALRKHLGVCLDLCHAAVAYEELPIALARLERAGIAIIKIQISSDLKLSSFTRANLEALGRFDDPVYLHQVIERRADGLRHYRDLPEAMSLIRIDDPPLEWRVHCHVPIFRGDFGHFYSTQEMIREALALHRQQPLSRHLEVETYTWDALPNELRAEPVQISIARELAWTLRQLAS